MTALMWACVCETVNPIRTKNCKSCGVSKPRMVAVPARPLPPRTAWVPGGPRPCTDVENAGALKIVLAVLENKMTVEEAEGHLHNIFQGRELAP
jgi:hypothetical protein